MKRNLHFIIGLIASAVYAVLSTIGIGFMLKFFWLLFLIGWRVL